MKDVFVPDKNRLAHGLDFATGPGKILKHSRIFVAWVAVGLAAGAYEASHKHCLERLQFGKHLASFQMIQEKLVRSLSMLISILLLC